MPASDNPDIAFATTKRLLLSILSTLGFGGSALLVHPLLGACVPLCLTFIWLSANRRIARTLTGVASLVVILILLTIDVATGMTTALFLLLQFVKRSSLAYRAFVCGGTAIMLSLGIFALASGAFGGSLLAPLILDLSNSSESARASATSLGAALAGSLLSVALAVASVAPFWLQRPSHRLVVVAAGVALLSLTWGSLGLLLLTTSSLLTALLLADQIDHNIEFEAEYQLTFRQRIVTLALGLVASAVLSLAILEYHLPPGRLGPSVVNTSLRGPLACHYRWRTQGHPLDEELLFARFPRLAERFDEHRENFEAQGELYGVSELAALMSVIRNDGEGIDALSLRCERDLLMPVNATRVTEAFEWVTYPDGDDMIAADLGRETIFSPRN